MSEKLTVRLGSRSYPIHIGNGVLRDCASRIRSVSTAKDFVVLTVPKVNAWYGRVLASRLKKIGRRVTTLCIPDGETQKNPSRLMGLLRRMAQLGLQRDACLVTLGGGVIGDLGSLAASLYMRGVDLIQIPTTLLAQVDASIGGKTAIDFAGIKNLIGTFYQPKLVMADPLVLKTLPDRHVRTGLAEIIKYGIIRDPSLFRLLEDRLESLLARDPRILLSVIRRACEIKAEIVSRDERESGLRAWLNYGHTFGHALEASMGYKGLSHGEAVAHGILFAAILSRRLGLCSKETVERQKKLLRRSGLLPSVPKFQSAQIIRRMLLDKKARDGKISFILTSKIGLVTIQNNVPKSLVFWAMKRLPVEFSE